MGALTWWASARLVGNAGQRVVSDILGLEKNTERIFGATFSKNYRVPDLWDRVSRIIYEVKNTSYVSWTRQLEDMATWAKENGHDFVLWVNQECNAQRWSQGGD